MQQQIQQIENQQKQLLEEPKKELNICEFYVERKKRHCKFVAVKGSKFCAAHCSDLQNQLECPYQKGFFVAASKFQKHLKLCPKLLNRRLQQKSQWFCKDVNKMDQNVEEAHVQQISNLTEVSSQQINCIIRLSIQLYLQKFDQKQAIYFIQSSQKEHLTNTTNDHKQAELITQKAFENNLIGTDFIYVEFGAGKGILSFAIATKIQQTFNKHSKNILLERQSRRNKFDKYFRDNPYFQRYKGDVSNFDFKLLPRTMAKTAIEKCNLKTDAEQIQKQIVQHELIGVCKHMCGQALDISVRGLLQGNTKGCILASCCHHRCKYNTYLNPKFFQKQGLKPQQIQVIFKMSSWGTKSHKFPNLSFSIFEQLKLKGYDQYLAQQKILIGRILKRLIDAGRAEFLEGRLYRYCSDQLTPQNYVIISRN